MTARLILAGVLFFTVPLGVVGLIVWNDVDRPLQDVERALSTKQAERALELVGLYLRDHPDDLRAQALKARVLVELGQLDDALRQFHRVGAADVADLHAWARAHLLRQQWSAALPVLERLLEISPNNPDALHEITACRAFLGKYRQAFESAEKLSAQPGHEARAWLQIGTLHENLGNKHSAAEAWGRVLDYEPNAENLQVTPADFLGEYGRILLEDGQPESARDALQRSLSWRESAQVLNSLGSARRQLGDEKGAATSWTRAVELAGFLREPREALAEQAMREGRFEQARDWLQPLVAGPKTASSSTYLMQRISLALDDQEAAEKWRLRTDELRRMEKLRATASHVLIESPDSFWARTIRAYQFAESGNWHEAETLMRTLLSESSREPFVRELIRSIQTRGPLPSFELLPITQF